MTKEMTVAEIAKALGYEIKVVKEQPKPYQFKAGDVVQCDFCIDENGIRLIVQPQYIKGLVAVDIHGKRKGNGSNNFDSHGYKKVGELKAFLVK